MGYLELILLAIGLSMDAFAVSVCEGISLKKSGIKKALACGAWFGVFQGLMPVIGYVLSANFERYINAVAPWIAFALLTLLGINMLKEAHEDDECGCCECKSKEGKTMFLLAIATSIDALAVGITFTCVDLKFLFADKFANALFGSAVICIITFVLSSLGVKVGAVFGSKWKKKSEIAGGVILVFIGLKILCEYLFF